MKECTHAIAIKDVEFCNNAEAGKNNDLCEFPDWEGKECPVTMFEKGEITEAEFYELWKKAWLLDNQAPQVKKSGD